MAAYFSEISITGDSTQEFLEIAVTQGTDTSSYSVVHYLVDGNGDGVVWRSYDLGTVESTISGQDVYTIDDSDPDVPVTTGEGNEMGNIYPDDAFALVDDTGTVVQFVSFYGNTMTPINGPAAGMTSTMIGTPPGGQSLQSDDGGATYYDQPSPNRNTIPCFAIGTLILTDTGYRAVETLRLGDRVETVDRGPQPIRWIRRYKVDLMRARSDQKPVRIKAGALGPNCPSRTLVISPQHRVLIGHKDQVPLHSQKPAFAPAKALTGLRGVSPKRGVQQQDYVHFALDHHEIVWAEGTLVESLFLGPEVISSLTGLQRHGLKTTANTHWTERSNTHELLTVAQTRLIQRELA